MTPRVAATCGNIIRTMHYCYCTFIGQTFLKLLTPEYPNRQVKCHVTRTRYQGDYFHDPVRCQAGFSLELRLLDTHPPSLAGAVPNVQDTGSRCNSKRF